MVQNADFDNDVMRCSLFDFEYVAHRKPACAHVHKTYAVLLVSAVGHLLGSESPLFEPLFKGDGSNHPLVITMTMLTWHNRRRSCHSSEACVAHVPITYIALLIS